MNRFALSSLVALALYAPALTPAFAQSDALTAGREATTSFVAGDLDEIWEAMTPDMQQALGARSALEAFQATIIENFGEPIDWGEEETLADSGFQIYSSTAQWTLSETPMVIQWAFGDDFVIAGFFIEPVTDAAESAYLDYETQTDLRLPFDGEWYVFWGGRNIADNYHAVDPAQRFAYDFVIHDEDGNSHAGEAGVLESYYCWGAEIVAPADGYVVAAVDDLPDQLIGETDAQNPAGNHVIVNLADEEYAFFAHLQSGSVRVQQGDEVSQGDVLGLCGNSGNTSEPHLHFHLQTTPDLFNGEGLPAQFQSYLANDEPIDRGEPIRGQTVAAQD